MKLHVKLCWLLLGWLVSILVLLGSSLAARADVGLHEVGLNFDVSEPGTVTTQDRSQSMDSNRNVSDLNAIVSDRVESGVLDFSVKDDRVESSVLDFSIKDDRVSAQSSSDSIEEQSLSDAAELFAPHQAETTKQARTTTVAQVVALRRAIIGQESGGKFDIVNPHSGALGYAQLMPANVKAWGREALGYAPSKRQFLSQPELQLRIVDHKIQQYWQQELQATGGEEQTAVLRVASRWYSGNANLYTSTRPQYYRAKNGKHYRYPSISAYSWSVWRKYQKQRG